MKTRSIFVHISLILLISGVAACSTATPEASSAVEVTGVTEENLVTGEIRQTKVFDQCESASTLKVEVQFSDSSSKENQEMLVLGAEVTGGVTLSPAAKIEVTGSVEKHFSESQTSAQGHYESALIEIPAHTKQEYTIIWTETRREGSVTYLENGEERVVSFSYRIGLELASTTGKDMECTGGESVSASITESNTISMTEVMSAPCGNDAGPDANEYIEIYNYGDFPVDVSYWRIGVGNATDGGKTDALIAWNKKGPPAMGSSVITDSTTIPAGGFGIIISSLYTTKTGRYSMPYKFPKDTIILTVEDSKYLGDDYTGLLGSTDPLTTIVLYIGTPTIIDEVISTYGTPRFGASPANIMDDKTDAFPYHLSECYSIERVAAAGDDTLSNWREIYTGTPGIGNYQP